MKRMVYYCDHCGKEMDDFNNYVDMEIDTYIDSFRADLCKECAEKLDEMVKKFIERNINDAEIR